MPDLVCLHCHRHLSRLCAAVRTSQKPHLLSTILTSFRFRHYSRKPARPISSRLDASDAPHVTVIRPVKGFEPYLYECLAATFHQDYPTQKLSVHFCISSRHDPAHEVLQRLAIDYLTCDLRIFVEEEDPALAGNGNHTLGPNPKIRNMSRGYREAKGDIVWIIDCNVWVGRGACGRMVDTLCGLTESGPGKEYIFVHQLPICVDVADCGDNFEAYQPVNGTASPRLSLTKQKTASENWSALQFNGGRLEEVFLSSSHAKFYIAINTVAIAPCIVGKSNMFRRSHLNHLTSSPSSAALSSSNPSTSEATNSQTVGIDHFSYNICEDHLIGDLLWRSSIPGKPLLGKHCLVFGDLAIQPIANMTLSAYIARRVRWLRVRKFTVTLATFVEPGTESFLCSAYGAYALTTMTWAPQTWTAFGVFWLLSVILWAAVDWTVYLLLHSGKTVEMDVDAEIPPFAKPLGRLARRPFCQWLFAWLGREALALPIWMWAFWGGVTVTWRDRRFWVGIDMKVHEIDDGPRASKGMNVNGNGAIHSRKSRID